MATDAKKPSAEELLEYFSKYFEHPNILKQAMKDESFLRRMQKSKEQMERYKLYNRLTVLVVLPLLAVIIVFESGLLRNLVEFEISIRISTAARLGVLAACIAISILFFILKLKKPFLFSLFALVPTFGGLVKLAVEFNPENFSLTLVGVSVLSYLMVKECHSAAKTYEEIRKSRNEELEKLKTIKDAP